MKRARMDARGRDVHDVAPSDDDDDDDDDATRETATTIALARAASRARRASTWLDAGGRARDEGSRVEINFPTSGEEYARLLLESNARESVRGTIERKLTGDGGEEEWKVSAVIVPETEGVDEDGDAAAAAEEETAAAGTWVQSYDAESDAFYYFHSETQETSWDRPIGVKIILDEVAAEKVAKDEAEKKTREEERRERAYAEARTDAEVTGDALDALKKHTSVDVAAVKLPGLKSWYYEDDYKNWQGPFTAAQLMTWRSMLPMDLRLFEHGDESAETTLAEVLGDTPIAAQCAALGIVLPPRATAAHAQYALRTGRAEALAPETEPGTSDEAPNDWARAVLEGLPPEQAIMRGADPAEVARKVLEKRAADLESSYGTTAVYNKFLHKITDASTIAKPTSVYADIGLDNYVDTNSFEAALYEMKNRKSVKLTRKQIEKLKERKRKIKDKFNNEWLRKDD